MIEAALREVDASMRRLALGARPERCGEMAVEHLGTGGRRLRARLALGVADAFGADPEAAVGWATAVELLHNATLVHDDLQDGDPLRRNRPAVWAQHGAAQAINVGDLLLMLPFAAIGALSVPASVRVRLFTALTDRAIGVVRGQTADLDLTLDRVVDWEAWAAVAEQKTAGLFVLPIEGAAILGGLELDAAAAVASTAHPLGVLYQAVDDVVDLFGDKGRGSPGRDVCDGKVTALVVEHLARRPEDRARLVALRGVATPADIEGVARDFRDSGALAAVRGRVAALTARVVESDRLALYPNLRATLFVAMEQALAPLAAIPDARPT